MNKIFKFFAERHLLATIFTLGIIIAGLITLFGIQKDLFPRVKLNNIFITTTYPGASPEDVELNVTNKIESELKAVNSIKKITSISVEDMSFITIQCDDNLNDYQIDKVLQDARDSINRINNLPRGVREKITIERLKESQFPILNIGISGETNYRKLRKISKDLEKLLKSNISGIAQIDKFGYKEKQVRINLNAEKLDLYKIPIIEVMEAISKRNIRETAGSIESYTSQKDIVTLAQFNHVEDVNDVIIRSTFEGHNVKVKDLAKIEDDFKKDEVIPRVNGKEVILFQIKKKENADIVKTIEKIKNLLEKEKAHLPKSIKIIYSDDYSRYVKASFDVVLNNGLAGFILVIIILTIFLSFRVSIWVALGIPVSLLGTIALLPAFNVTLDVITLAAMILVLGIIVDDAIVISESIFQEWEKGEKPINAAIKGLKKVFWPVVTTVASTLLAFLPMFLIPGDTGKYIFVIPLVICLSLIISLVEGVIALPAHISHDLKKTSKKNIKIENSWVKKIIDKIILSYRKLLSLVLKHRYKYITSFTLLFFFCIGISSTMKIKLFPTEGAEEFAIYMKTPIGTPLKTTSLYVKKVEKIVSGLPQNELSSYTTLVGNQEESLNQENIASIRVNLTPHSKRARNANEIVEVLRNKSSYLVKNNIFEQINFNVDDSGPNPEKPISLNILGENNKIRKKLADDIIAFLGKTQGVKDISRNDKIGKRQIEIKIDYEKLARYQLTVADIADTLRIIYDGEIVTKMQQGNEEVKFKITFVEKQRSDPKYLLNFKIPNNDGSLIPIKNFATTKIKPGPANYYHINSERAINIQARNNPEIISPEEVITKITDNFNLKKSYPGMRFLVEGEAKRNEESLGDLGQAFTLAIIGIYFLLILLFNSATQPLIVLIAIPFGFCGVILIFFLHGQPWSFMGFLGAIGLTGVVVNDSLVMVDHLNRLTKKKLSSISLLQVIANGASQRFRAIIMTTVSTAAGLIPLAYEIGGSDPFNVPMALALGWGLLLATPLTLFLIPCLYMVGKDFETIKHRLFKKIASISKNK